MSKSCTHGEPPGLGSGVGGDELAMSEHPDFVIVCDHRIRGGHLDELVRYTWPDHRDPRIGYWGEPKPGLSGEVRQTQLAGNRPRTNSIFTTDPDPPRLHHEIICVTPHCRCRAYRSDVARLQTLFRAITDDSVLRDVVAVSVTDIEITITLEALHLARDTAKRARGLDV
jgi:hypothetical protein